MAIAIRNFGQKPGDIRLNVNLLKDDNKQYGKQLLNTIAHSVMETVRITAVLTGN